MWKSVCIGNASSSSSPSFVSARKFCGVGITLILLSYGQRMGQVPLWLSILVDTVWSTTSVTPPFTLCWLFITVPQCQVLTRSGAEYRQLPWLSMCIWRRDAHHECQGLGFAQLITPGIPGFVIYLEGFCCGFRPIIWACRIFLQIGTDPMLIALPFIRCMEVDRDKRDAKNGFSVTISEVGRCSGFSNSLYKLEIAAAAVGVALQL